MLSYSYRIYNSTKKLCIEEKTLEHIHTSSGMYLDPQVVDVFMQIPNKINSRRPPSGGDKYSPVGGCGLGALVVSYTRNPCIQGKLAYPCHSPGEKMINFMMWMMAGALMGWVASISMRTNNFTIVRTSTYFKDQAFNKINFTYEVYRQFMEVRT